LRIVRSVELVLGLAKRPNNMLNPARFARWTFLQHIQHMGPIPRGTYKMTGWVISHNTMGPNVIRLTPEPGTQTFGRSNFLIHGDSSNHPGEASTGCIIVGGAHNRAMIWNSGNRFLEVVE
jgi:hypothetical protein